MKQVLLLFVCLDFLQELNIVCVKALPYFFSQKFGMCWAEREWLICNLEVAICSGNKTFKLHLMSDDHMAISM